MYCLSMLMKSMAFKLCSKTCPTDLVKFCVTFQRSIICGAVALEKNSENSNQSVGITPKKKYKITVVRKCFPQSGEKPVIKEWVSASSVIKRFNWETKCLFGPLQSPKSEERKVHDSGHIIQHATKIPICEPRVLHSDISEINIDSNENISKSMSLDCILEFPLMNKTEHFSQKLDATVEKSNILRKYLEHLKEGLNIPSVSAILEKTMPPDRVAILERWKQNMIKELGEEGFKKYQTELLANGSSLHSSINSYLSSTPEAELVLKDENLGHWKSLTSVLPDINRVKLLEEMVSHPFLCYRGIVDCFATYKNQLVVIDWKTSKKPKLTAQSLYDNPLQMAAYVGALNFDPKFQYLAKTGVIVVAYESGAAATVHFISEAAMVQYWKQWLKRLKLFWENIRQSKEL